MHMHVHNRTESNTKLQWAVDMSGASPIAADILVNNTLSDIEAGYTGSWCVLAYAAPPFR